MAHYAIIDNTNAVVNVIVGKDENLGIDFEKYYAESIGQTVLRTSINTVANQHKNNKQPFRKNYASVGGTYDPVNDAFIDRQPYPSWILNTTTFSWEAPVQHEDRGEGIWFWVEDQPDADDDRVQGWNFVPIEST